MGMLGVECLISLEKDTVTSVHPGTLVENPKFCLKMQDIEIYIEKNTQVLLLSSGGNWPLQGGSGVTLLSGQKETALIQSCLLPHSSGKR